MSPNDFNAETVRKESVSVSVKPRNSLPTMLGALIALAIVAVVVWMNRGVPDGVQPPPVMPKSVAQVEKEIASVKADSKLPESNKQRILGFLNQELESSRTYEARKTK